MSIFDDIKDKLKGADIRLQEEIIYAEVLAEIKAGIRRDGLWAKALSESNGDINKTKALYIKYRAQSLIDEFKKYNTRGQRKKREKLRQEEEKLRQEEEKLRQEEEKLRQEEAENIQAEEKLRQEEAENIQAEEKKLRQEEAENIKAKAKKEAKNRKLMKERTHYSGSFVVIVLSILVIFGFMIQNNGLLFSTLWSDIEGDPFLTATVSSFTSSFEGEFSDEDSKPDLVMGDEIENKCIQTKISPNSLIYEIKIQGNNGNAFAIADFNNDNELDKYIIRQGDSDWCGSGGCHAFLYLGGNKKKCYTTNLTSASEGGYFSFGRMNINGIKSIIRTDRKGSPKCGLTRDRKYERWVKANQINFFTQKNCDANDKLLNDEFKRILMRP